MRPWRRVQAVPIRERRSLRLGASCRWRRSSSWGSSSADATGPLYYRGGSLLVALVAAGLIATVERVPDGPVARLLAWRPLVLVGVISYGLYLWHWPVVVATAPADPAADTLPLVPLRLALTFGLAAVMFVAIERPIREGRLPVMRRSSWRTLAASAAAIAVAAGISMRRHGPGLPGGARARPEALPPSGRLRRRSHSRSRWTRGTPSGAPAPVSTPGAVPCHQAPVPAGRPASARGRPSLAPPVPTAEPTPAARAALRPGGGRRLRGRLRPLAVPQRDGDLHAGAGQAGAPTIVTFGDSSIGSLDVGLTEWAMGSGATYVVAASGGCTVSGVPRSNDPAKAQKGPMDAKCEARYDSIVDQVAALPGPVVVLATAVSEYRPVVLPDGSVAPFGTAAHLAAVEVRAWRRWRPGWTGRT